MEFLLVVAAKARIFTRALSSRCDCLGGASIHQWRGADADELVEASTYGTLLEVSSNMAG
jgi:hypothetical protein